MLYLDVTLNEWVFVLLPYDSQVMIVYQQIMSADPYNTTLSWEKDIISKSVEVNSIPRSSSKVKDWFTFQIEQGSFGGHDLYVGLRINLLLYDWEIEILWYRNIPNRRPRCLYKSPGRGYIRFRGALLVGVPLLDIMVYSYFAKKKV